jgi:integrase
MHRVLKLALGRAVKWELLQRNPCDAVDPSKVERKAPVTYDTDEAVDVLETLRPPACSSRPLCGLRRGEITALRWHSVDLDRGQLAVVANTEQLAGKGNCREKETKGTRNRTIALSAQVVAELRAHKLRQAEELLRLGARPQRDSHVVAKEDGTPIQPRSLTHEC